MRLPEEHIRDEQKPDKHPPFSYTVYCALGWAFVFIIYAILFMWGYKSIPRFWSHLSRVFIILSIWEVTGIFCYVRWHLPLGPSGGLMMLYELLFPWKYPLTDKERKWLS